MCRLFFGQKFHKKFHLYPCPLTFIIKMPTQRDITHSSHSITSSLVQMVPQGDITHTITSGLV